MQTANRVFSYSSPALDSTCLLDFSHLESRNPTHTRLHYKITHIRGRVYLYGGEGKISALSRRVGGHGGVADDDDDDDDDDVREASLGMGDCVEAGPY